MLAVDWWNHETALNSKNEKARMENKQDGVEVPDMSKVPSALKAVLTKLKQAIDIKNIRSFGPFLGLGETKAFGIPESSQVVRRAKHNTLFFATNYAILVMAVAVVVIFMHPIFLVGLACIVAGWMYVAKLAKNDDVHNPIFLFGRQIASRERSIAMLMASLLIIFFFGGGIIFTILSSSGLIISAHVLLRAYPIPEDDELGFLSEVDFVDV